MSMIRHIVGGLRALLRKRASDRDLDDEVRQYLESATQEHMRAGMSRAHAERAARVDFGGVENAKEVVRSAVSTMRLADWSSTRWSYAFKRIRIFCFAMFTR